jgi:hypothetical protein
VNVPDPHDRPLTEAEKKRLREETARYGDAVRRLVQLRDVVEAETKAGLPANPLEAHRALDQIDLLLQWLPGIARDSGVAKEHWESINTAAGELRELFEKVHLNIDNRSDPDFASVRERIDAKIAQLRAVAESQPASDPARKQ